MLGEVFSWKLEKALGSFTRLPLGSFEASFWEAWEGFFLETWRGFPREASPKMLLPERFERLPSGRLEGRPPESLERFPLLEA